MLLLDFTRLVARTLNVLFVCFFGEDPFCMTLVVVTKIMKWTKIWKEKERKKYKNCDSTWIDKLASAWNPGAQKWLHTQCVVFVVRQKYIHEYFQMLGLIKVSAFKWIFMASITNFILLYIFCMKTRRIKRQLLNKEQIYSTTCRWFRCECEKQNF